MNNWSRWIPSHSWVPDYRRWWMYDGILYQVKQRAGNRGITAQNMDKYQHTDFNEDTTDESASVGCSNVRLWKLDSQKDEETRLGAFEIKGRRKILRVSWTAKKTNEWVLNKAGVKRRLLDTLKARKLATTRKQGSCLKKEIMPARTTHGLDGQHQDVDRTLRGRVNQNDNGQG